MLIDIGDKVKYWIRIGNDIKNSTGIVDYMSDELYIVKDDKDGKNYSVWASDVELVIGGRSEDYKYFDEHYAKLSAQPMDIVSEWTTEQIIGFIRGNILKYIMRLGKKDNALQEARKILRYAQWLVEVLEGKKINPRE